MRKPSTIPGIDPDLLKRYPADSLRALGERLGTDDARAGARVNVEYLRYALGRVAAFRHSPPELSTDEVHELAVGLVLGMDEFLKMKRTS